MVLISYFTKIENNFLYQVGHLLQSNIVAYTY